MTRNPAIAPVASPILWIAIGAALLRCFDLHGRSLWFDEAVSFLIARADLAGAIHAADAERLPPLYNVVLHLVLAVFPGEIAARFLSVLAGAATVPIVYLLGVRLGDRTAGLLAAVLLAVSPFHLWYAQEVRVYALQTLLAAASCLAALRLLDVPPEKRDPAGVLFYATATALALYAQYTSLFLVAAQNLFFVAGWARHRPAWKRWLAAQALAVVLFLPWLPKFVGHALARSGEFWLPPLSPGYLLAHFGNFAGAIQSRTPANGGLSWVGLIGVIVCGASALARKDARRAGAFLLAWGLVPAALLATVSLAKNVFLSRALLYTLPAVCLLVALAARPVLARSRGALSAAATLLLFFAGSVYGTARYFADPNPLIRPPHREVARRLANRCEDGDLVVHVSRFTYRPYQVYQDGRCAAGLLRETEDLPGLFAVIGDSRLHRDARGVDRIWLVAYDDFQQRGLAKRVVGWMNGHHERKEVLFADRRVFVALYQRKDDRAWPEVQ
jgi:4-amino-4-deoxy-L-arabinose transferase-like glycosyltransferase